MLSTLCPIYLIVASPTTTLPSSTTKTGLFLNCKYIVRHNINMFYLYTFYFMKSDWKFFLTPICFTALTNHAERKHVPLPTLGVMYRCTYSFIQAVE